jgi:hypothetical protein
MTAPSFTAAEQLLLEEGLIYLAGKKPDRAPEVTDALDTFTGPVLLDAVAAARDAYVAYGPTLTRNIADLNALLTKLKPAAQRPA